MHPAPTFRWPDQAAMRAFVADIAFGTLFAQTSDGPRVAHVPAIWLDDDRIGFHLSRGNALARHLEAAQALFVVTGAHAYVSPDYYGLPDQVGTWNYQAVELEGMVAALPDDRLPALLDALSDDREARLAPKPPWRRDKMTPGLFDKMTKAITGYEMRITAMRGTDKRGQHKPVAASAAVADRLDEAGDHGMATLMRDGIA